MRKALIGTLVVVTLLAWLAVPAGAAGALVSSSERQTIPGLTERTIWGRGQVYVYRLPRNVTHTGDLHVELTYTPATGGCFVYLLGSGRAGVVRVAGLSGHLRPGLPLAGARPSRWSTTRYPTVLDQTPTDESVVGDAYYAVVQAASGVSRVRLTGYLPRTVAGSTDTTSEATFTRFEFRTPASAKKTITVAGAPYGGAFDLTPTSQGRTECRLQYPADVRCAHRAGRDAGAAASFEQYVYPYLWEPVGGQIPLSQPTDYSHWDLYDQNRHAAAPLAGDDWYGLQGGFTVQAGGPWRPRATYHYVPVLWLAAAQPYALAPARARPAGDGPAHRRLQGDPAHPAEPPSGLGDEEGAQGQEGDAQGDPRGAAERGRGRAGPVGSGRDAGHGAAQGRTRLDAGPDGEDRRERRLACLRARAAHDQLACRRPAGSRPRRRVLARQAHRRHPLTPASAPPLDDVVPRRAPRTWFARRFVIQLREFAASMTWSRGRRAQTTFPVSTESGGHR